MVAGNCNHFYLKTYNQIQPIRHTPMKKTIEIKLMIIENFIDHFTSSDKERESMKKCAALYVDGDHVDEIAQAFPEIPATIDGLTNLENKVLDYLCKELSTWRETEPGYSCLEGSDVTRDLKLNPRTTSGVISSLCKKGYLTSEDEGHFKGIIYVDWQKIPDDFGRIM